MATGESREPLTSDSEFTAAQVFPVHASGIELFPTAVNVRLAARRSATHSCGIPDPNTKIYLNYPRGFCSSPVTFAVVTSPRLVQTNLCRFPFYLDQRTQSLVRQWLALERTIVPAAASYLADQACGVVCRPIDNVKRSIARRWGRCRAGKLEVLHEPAWNRERARCASQNRPLARWILRRDQHGRRSSQKILVHQHDVEQESRDILCVAQLQRAFLVGAWTRESVSTIKVTAIILEKWKKLFLLYKVLALCEKLQYRDFRNFALSYREAYSVAHLSGSNAGLLFRIA